MTIKPSNRWTGSVTTRVLLDHRAHRVFKFRPGPRTSEREWGLRWLLSRCQSRPALQLAQRIFPSWLCPCSCGIPGCYQPVPGQDNAALPGSVRNRRCLRLAASCIAITIRVAPNRCLMVCQVRRVRCALRLNKGVSRFRPFAVPLCSSPAPVMILPAPSVPNTRDEQVPAQRVRRGFVVDRPGGQQPASDWQRDTGQQSA